jgi:hypothetical protein
VCKILSVLCFSTQTFSVFNPCKSGSVIRGKNLSVFFSLKSSLLKPVCFLRQSVLICVILCAKFFLFCVFQLNPFLFLIRVNPFTNSFRLRRIRVCYPAQLGSVIRGKNLSVFFSLKSSLLKPVCFLWQSVLICVILCAKFFLFPTYCLLPAVFTAPLSLQSLLTRLLAVLKLAP